MSHTGVWHGWICRTLRIVLMSPLNRIFFSLIWQLLTMLYVSHITPPIFKPLFSAQFSRHRLMTQWNMSVFKLNALQPLLKILDPPALFEILYGLCLYLFFTKQSKFWSHHTDLANKSRIRLFVRRLPPFKVFYIIFFYPLFNFPCQI